MLYALKDCANLTIAKSTGEKVLFVNYAKTSTLEFSADSVFAMNKNTKAVRFDSNRDGTFKTTMEVFPMDIIPLLFGTEFHEETDDWAKRYVAKVTSSNVVTLPTGITPVAGSVQVYVIDENDELTHKQEVTASGTSTPASGKYYISTSGSGENAVTTLSFNSEFADKTVAVYYAVKIPSKEFTIDTISFPGGYKIWGDSAIRGTNQVDEFVQFELFNVKPQSTATLTMDVDNICTLEITWDIMSDSKGNMMKWKTVA